MNAEKKWLQLFFEILTYEFDHTGDGQLLSEAGDRLVLKHPVWGRMFILAAGAAVTLHLSNSLPERFDVLSQFFWRGILKRSR